MNSRAQVNLEGPQDFDRNVDLLALKQQLGLRQVVGKSAAITGTLQRLPLLARSGATLLIKGETGTGKELFARAAHYLSRQSDGPFVPVNCGAVPIELVENELFGHASGAFTGATGSRDGLVAEAESGTLFLDEVDALPCSAQVKLLRLLQEKEYRPLGARRCQRANVRVVAASNADLEHAVESGRFRRDLYYRLDVLSLSLPPLRERADDVTLLAEHFLARFGAQYDRGQPSLSPAARQRLLEYDWPGNVRQLENVLERATILCQSGRVEAHDIELPGVTTSEPPVGFQSAKAEAIERFERDYLRKLLATHRGNITHAARAAGKNRRALFELIRKHQIAVQTFRADDL